MSYSLQETIFQEEIYSIPPQSVVVLNKAWEKISDSEKSLLEKILGLAQVSLNQVQIISLQKLDILQWRERQARVLAFGLNTPGLSTNEVLDVQEVKLVVTADLATLETAPKEIKQKLATAVKSLFD